MSTNDKIWVLLDGITKIQSQPLKTEQLQLAILKLNERDWSRFYVWTQGWKNWQLLKDFLNSDQKDFSVTGVTASEKSVKAHIQAQIENNNKIKTANSNKLTTTINPSEDTFTPASMEKDFNGDHVDENAFQNPPQSLDFKEINEAYKNRAERHELKIEVLLISQKGKTFKSYSKNISLSGSLLEDNIPFEFYGVQFDLVVVNRSSLDQQNSRVQMRAETVGEGLTQRVRFVNSSAHLKQRLMNLLNDYLAKQSQLKKTS